jgi:hypothetical protein
MSSNNIAAETSNDAFIVSHADPNLDKEAFLPASSPPEVKKRSTGRKLYLLAFVVCSMIAVGCMVFLFVWGLVMNNRNKSDSLETGTGSTFQPVTLSASQKAAIEQSTELPKLENIFHVETGSGNVMHILRFI